GDAVTKRALEPAQECLVEPLAVGEQHHDRHDAPRDAQHRQHGARAVAHEADDRFAQDVPHPSYLSASTGGSRAARRAGYVEVTTPISARAPMAMALASHVITMPWKRGGMGIVFTAAQSSAASAK